MKASSSEAALKAFCGERGGVVCRSSNARQVLEWAWARKPRVFFFPDQHLGRNTAVAMGVPLDHTADWEYRVRDLERVNARCFRDETRIILWRGSCSVHGKFTVAAVVLFVAAVLLHVPLLLAPGAVLLGVSSAAGSLGWTLGHNDFAPRGEGTRYMALHVTLTGIRGLVAPPLTIAEYHLLDGLQGGSVRRRCSCRCSSS